jgi:SAM-dependent methyltransferase
MKAQQVWAAGDYSAIAPHLASAADRVVHLAAIAPDDTVLDVACGTGNAALRAAERGARVTGLDVTPELLQQARDQAPDLTWVEGDAQDLPFDDASFDVVLSVFGCMFAPDHRRTASEILRVLRPGGRVVIASWTPDGDSARLLRLVSRHLPPPPGDPPVLWGDERHVRELFPGATCEHAFIHFVFASTDEAADFYIENFGPAVAANGAADDDVRAFFGDVGAAYDAEYLILRARADGAAPT